MAEQDRALWDRASIAEGTALAAEALSRTERFGPYQLQAAIAAVHDEAVSDEETDWPQILALYQLLRAVADGPVVRLNQAVATAKVHGPTAGLAILDDAAADARLAGSHRVDAVRAHLLEEAGETEAARSHYLTAASRTTSLPERRYLLTRAERLSEIDKSGR